MVETAESATAEQIDTFHSTCNGDNSDSDMKKTDNAYYLIKTHGDTIATTFVDMDFNTLGYSIMYVNWWMLSR